MLGISALITFLLVTGVVFLLAAQMKSAFQHPVRRRLKPQQVGARELRGSELIDSLAAQLPQREAARSELAVELRRAGYFKSTAVNVFLSLRNGAVIAIILIAGLVALLMGPERQELVVRVLVAGLAAAGLCWGLPRLLVKMRGTARVERVSRALPFALDMTVMCVNGGLTLREALAHVSHEIGTAHPDLAAELSIVQHQSDMSSMESAFRQFAQRINSPEVAAMVALIIQNEQLGTNIASSLREYADAIRLKWRQFADERAGRIGVYMLFPLSLCLLPAVFLILWGPAALDLLEFLQDMEARIPEPPDISR